jgi:hypothetical protein
MNPNPEYTQRLTKGIAKVAARRGNMEKMGRRWFGTAKNRAFHADYG